MAVGTYFNQECPICGRSLRIAIDLLGEHVCCRHCGGEFVARDQAWRRDPAVVTVNLIQRANRLLEMR